MTGHSTGGGLCSLCGTKVNNSDESQYLRGQAAKAHETSEQEILPLPQTNKCTASHYIPSSYFLVSAPHLLLWSVVSLRKPSNLYLYFRTVHVVIFILFKPTHALFLNAFTFKTLNC